MAVIFHFFGGSGGFQKPPEAKTIQTDTQTRTKALLDLSASPQVKKGFLACGQMVISPGLIWTP